MMKKNGFTLAEVLITLAIIGVVATLTLPALMTNTQEQQAKTAFKKGINTLTEAAQMNQAIAGWDYATITSNNTDKSAADDQSLYNLFSERTNMDYKASGLNKGKLKGTTDATSNYAVFFRDGSVLMYKPQTTAAAAEGKGTALQEDGLVYGIPAIYDTNGLKGPNILSNCESNVTGLDKETVTDIKKCNDKKVRVIKDQFGVRLRGGYAVPNGAAARWAFEN